MRIGTALPLSRSAAQTSMPLVPGSSTSRISASYELADASDRACGPVPAWSTAYDASRNPRAIDSRSCRSSSARRMRMRPSYAARTRHGQSRADALQNRSALLFHEGEGVAFAVAELAEPQLVVRHPGDNVRRVDELHAFRGQVLVHSFDVLDLIVEDRAEVVVLGPLGRREHEAYSAAVEELQARGRVEQVAESEDALVERLGARHVLADDGDLSDVGVGEVGHGWNPPGGGDRRACRPAAGALVSSAK